MQMISDVRGPVAQWIRRLTTDQEIPGSSPGRVVLDTAITSHGHDYRVVLDTAITSHGHDYSFPVRIPVSVAFVKKYHDRHNKVSFSILFSVFRQEIVFVSVQRYF